MQRIAKLARTDQRAQKSKALVNGFGCAPRIGRDAHGCRSTQLHEQLHALFGDVFQHLPVVITVTQFARTHFKRGTANDAAGQLLNYGGLQIQASKIYCL